jgi:hypothetical protein
MALTGGLVPLYSALSQPAAVALAGSVRHNDTETTLPQSDRRATLPTTQSLASAGRATDSLYWGAWIDNRSPSGIVVDPTPDADGKIEVMFDDGGLRRFDPERGSLIDPATRSASCITSTWILGRAGIVGLAVRSRKASQNLAIPVTTPSGHTGKLPLVIRAPRGCFTASRRLASRSPA